jgi:exonuclease SbcD
MRILHTADWHLGQSPHNIPLIADQRHVLEQIVSIAETERPDVVIIAGDVFDRSSPPPDAVALLDWVVGRLVLDLGRRVIMIAGNHDSGERIGCFGGLLGQRGLHLYGIPSIPVSSLVINDNIGPVRFYVMPFVEPYAIRYLTQSEAIKTQQQAYETMLSSLGPASAERSVFVGHAFVTGGEAAGSERQLSVGGSEAVAAELFARFSYVALGHLHRPQSLLGGKIRYPGSLLAYSFDEAGQNKSVSIVDMDGTGLIALRIIDLKPRRAMRRVRGQIVKGEFILEGGSAVPETEDFVEVTLTNDGTVVDAMSIVQARFPNTLNLQWEKARLYTATTGTTVDLIRTKTPIDLLRSFYLAMQGKDLTGIQLELARKAAEEAEKETGP